MIKMPSKKKKYNARFPAGRIKKIMQTDEEVGKVAQAVPIIISRTLELFVESLLAKTVRVTNARNAKTLSPSHMKQCIMSESRFDFLRELVKNIPDISLNDEMLECGSPGEQTGENSSTSAPSSPPPTCSRMVALLQNGVTVQQHPNGPAAQNTQSISLDLPSTSSSSMNFYKEADISMTPQPQHHNQPVIKSTVIQHTSNHNSNNNKTNSNSSNNIINPIILKRDYSRPPKLARFDSVPCYKIDLPPKINTPNITYQTSSTNNKQPFYSIDLSKNFNLHQPLASPSNSSNNPPSIPRILPADIITPVLNIDLSNSFQNLPSTSNEMPSPPIIKSEVCCNTPTVKIDYSSIALITSPLCSPNLPSSPINVAVSQKQSSEHVQPLQIDSSGDDGNSGLSNSSTNSYITAKQPTPSTASIDLTNIHNNSNFTNTKNMLSNNSLEMDEDYDNI